MNDGMKLFRLLFGYDFEPSFTDEQCVVEVFKDYIRLQSQGPTLSDEQKRRARANIPQSVFTVLQKVVDREVFHVNDAIEAFQELKRWRDGP
jgi:hypothetical protein